MSIDNTRRMRYKSKISYILTCLTEINEVLPTPSGIILKGVFYNLSTAIESEMDMVAMLCKDLGIMPKGDYENTQSVNDRQIIGEDLSQSLAKCNGLRNFLIHRYNGVDDSIVVNSIKSVNDTLLQFIGVVEAYLNES